MALVMLMLSTLLACYNLSRCHQWTGAHQAGCLVYTFDLIRTREWSALIFVFVEGYWCLQSYFMRLRSLDAPCCPPGFGLVVRRRPSSSTRTPTSDEWNSLLSEAIASFFHHSPTYRHCSSLVEPGRRTEPICSRANKNKANWSDLTTFGLNWKSSRQKERHGLKRRYTWMATNRKAIEASSREIAPVNKWFKRTSR